MDMAGAPQQRSRPPGQPLRILAGLVAGLLIGIALAGSEAEAPMLAVARPVGKLWIDALTMTVVPLVFSLLVTGIAGAASSAGGLLARRAIAWFAGLLIAACLFSAAATTLALHAWPVPEAAGALRTAAPPPQIAPAGAFLDNLIPTNVIAAAADTAMVPLVLFALLFGFAIARIDAPLRAPVRALFAGTAQVMLVIVNWVLLLAPLGIFALAIGVGVAAGVGAAGVLLHYMLIVIASCLLALLLAWVAAALAGGLSPGRFALAALPPQLVAISTQSSLASLPAMVAAAAPMGVPGTAAGVLLPMAVSLFRLASAAANVTVAVWLADVHGVALAPADLAIGALVAAAVSVAAVGLPAQVSFFGVVGPVCIAMGVPITLLPLLLAIETIPDMFRTLGNVTGGLAVTRIVGRNHA
jgi:Na+/H+-dicarboxylate symporter